MFPPALTAIPRKKKMTIETTLRSDSQYSSYSSTMISFNREKPDTDRVSTKAYLSISLDVDHIDSEEEEEEEE